MRRGILRVAAGLLALLAIAGFIGSQGAISQTSWRRIEVDPSWLNLTFENVVFESEDHLRLTAWWIPAQGDPPRIVLLVHGMSGNRSTNLDRVKWLVHAGYSVLAIDTRGHGGSEGQYMSSGHAEAKDVLGALEYLRKRFPGASIALYGVCQGANAVLIAAWRRQDRITVIADTPYMPGYRALWRSVRYVWTTPTGWEVRMFAIAVAIPGANELTRGIFRLRTGTALDPADERLPKVVPRIKGPVLLIAGNRDSLITSDELNGLVRLSPNRNAIAITVPGQNHDPFVESPGAYKSTVEGFLSLHLGGQ